MRCILEAMEGMGSQRNRKESQDMPKTDTEDSMAAKNDKQESG